jgi:hypothetical protein
MIPGVLWALSPWGLEILAVSAAFFPDCLDDIVIEGKANQK